MAAPTTDVRAHIAMLHELIAAKQTEEQTNAARWQAEISSLQAEVAEGKRTNMKYLHDLESIEDERAALLDKLEEKGKESEAYAKLKDDVAAILRMQEEQVQKLDGVVHGVEMSPGRSSATLSGMGSALQQLVVLQQQQIDVLQRSRTCGGGGSATGGLSEDVAASLEALLEQQEKRLEDLCALKSSGATSSTAATLRRVIEGVQSAGSSTFQLMERISTEREDGVVHHDDAREGKSVVAGEGPPPEGDADYVRLQTTQTHVRELQERLSDALADRDEALNVPPAEVESLRQHIERLERALEECRGDCDEKDNVIARLQRAASERDELHRAAVESLRHEIDIVTASRDTALGKLKGTESKGSYDLTVVQTSLDKANARCAALEGQLKDLQEELRRERAQHRLASERLKEARGALQDSVNISIAADSEGRIVQDERERDLAQRLDRESAKVVDLTSRCTQLETHVQALHDDAARHRREMQESMAQCQHLMTLLRERGGSATPRTTAAHAKQQLGPKSSPPTTASTPRTSANVTLLSEMMSSAASEVERALERRRLGSSSTPSPDAQPPPQPTPRRNAAVVRQSLIDNIRQREQRHVDLETHLASVLSELSTVVEHETRLNERKHVALDAIEDQKAVLSRNIREWAMRLGSGSASGDTRGRYQSMLAHAQGDLDRMVAQEHEIMSTADSAIEQTRRNREVLQARAEEVRDALESVHDEIVQLKQKEACFHGICS